MSILLYLVSIIFIGSLVNSTFGFGFALMTMPLLSLQFDLATIGPMIPLLFLVGGGLIAFRSRRHIQFSCIFPLILTASLMVPVGVYLGKHGPEQWIKIILGIFIILFSLYNLSSTQLRHFSNDKWAPLFGGLSGLFAGAYNISGPPIVIYGTLRQWSAQSFRATLQAYFLYVNLLVIGNHYWMGSYKNPKIGIYFLYACPAMLLAIPIGKKINKKISNPKAFNKYVYILMLLSGILLIAKVLNHSSHT